MDYNTIVENNLADLLKDKSISIVQLFNSNAFDDDDDDHTVVIGIIKNKTAEIFQILINESKSGTTYEVGFSNPVNDNQEDNTYSDKKFYSLTEACKFISTYFYKVIELRQKILTQYKLLVNDANAVWRMML